MDIKDGLADWRIEVTGMAEIADFSDYGLRD
jgi:hypothetical protein